MQIIDSEQIKRVKQAREIIDTQQKRIWQLEQTLDDLARACEIAQYSQQYNLTETFRDTANDMLQDRLVAPEVEQGAPKFKIITGEIDEELNHQLSNKAKVAAGAT
jgi:hypothetical protein